MRSFDDQLRELVEVLSRLNDTEGWALYNIDEAKAIARKLMTGGRARDERRFQEKQEPVDGRWIFTDSSWHRHRKTWADEKAPLLFTYCRKAFETYLVEKIPPPTTAACQVCETAWKATGKPEPA